MHNKELENPQEVAACRACWEKNPEVPFADFWAGWKALLDSMQDSRPVAIVRHTKTEVLERFDAVVLAGAILEGVVEDGTKLYARPSAPVPPQVEARPVAYIHTMHYEEGCGSSSVITASEHHPYGKPDVDYDKTFTITSDPLFKISATKEGKGDE